MCDLLNLKVYHYRILRYKLCVNCVIELRSSEDKGVDVGKIAKENGGGGHTHAAGFPIKNIPEIFNDILNSCIRL